MNGILAVVVSVTTKRVSLKLAKLRTQYTTLTMQPSGWNLLAAATSLHHTIKVSEKCMLRHFDSSNPLRSLLPPQHSNTLTQSPYLFAPHQRNEIEFKPQRPLNNDLLEIRTFLFLLTLIYLFVPIVQFCLVIKCTNVLIFHCRVIT